ncbi:hypothetical protein L53_08625 [Hyphomonas sp. L-53-1-40]|uniref:COG4223 family protein n=1 Tax=Hyphomonas sp. L-53-1-40 TaxID=1207058 RepID=UPI00045906EE|nr:mitofilin family membrane protein [Hyphomonas sp. L-53-1-40]KCZ63324.1 hypothetical protein L53_08625 [Hyphomonas sp. L-53-1-40]
MTEDSTPEDDHIDSSEPIDADFEPAPEEAVRGSGGVSAGPGWLGALVLSLFAAGLGGILGMAGSRYLANNPTNPGTVDSRLTDMEAGQEEVSIRLARTIREQDGLSASISALATEVEALAQRETGSAATIDTSALDELQQRVVALESIDTTGEVSPEDVSRAVASLESRMERLARSVEQLEAAPSGVQIERVIEVETKLAELRDDLSEAKLSNSRDAEQMAGLIAGMRQDEAAARGAAEAASQTADMARAVSAIEAASRKGGGFAPELRMLRSQLPDDSSVRQLASISAEGAPTVAELQASFDVARLKAEAAIPDTSEEGLSWLNRAFGDAVSVRRLDGEDSEPDAILAKASEALAIGDLEETVEMINRLEGAPARAMADWTAQANRRITLEAALEALQQRLLEGKQ